MEIGFLLTQIGTWITILLVLFTLIEMRNQRKASQKPDLVIPKSTFYGYVYGREGKVVLVPRFWSSDKDVQEKEGYSWSESEPAKIYNVGFGVAKNIELKWTVDYAKALQQIKDYCYQYAIPIILRFEGDGVYVESDNFVSLSPQTYKHDFLMPASITSEGLTTPVPPAVRELLSILMCLRIHYQNQHYNELLQLELEVPVMKVELHYDDMENTHYKRRFEVVFSHSGYTVFSDESSVRGLTQLFGGSFEFKPFIPLSEEAEAELRRRAKMKKNK